MFKTKKALKKLVERLNYEKSNMEFKIKEIGLDISHYLEENRSLRTENEELRKQNSEFMNKYIAAVEENYELAKMLEELIEFKRKYTSEVEKNFELVERTRGPVCVAKE